MKAGTSGAGVLPRWVHLVPDGELAGYGGRRLRLSNPAEVIQATRARLPLCLDEASGTWADRPARACGWIVDLVAMAGLWGAVEWTPVGRELLQGRAYRFLAPVLSAEPAGEIKAVLGGGLTNVRPFRGMVPLDQGPPGGDAALFAAQLAPVKAGIEALVSERRQQMAAADPNWIAKAAREFQDREADAGRRISFPAAVQHVAADRRARWDAA